MTRFFSTIFYDSLFVEKQSILEPTRLCSVHQSLSVCNVHTWFFCQSITTALPPALKETGVGSSVLTAALLVNKDKRALSNRINRWKYFRNGDTAKFRKDTRGFKASSRHCLIRSRTQSGVPSMGNGNFKLPMGVEFPIPPLVTPSIKPAR